MSILEWTWPGIGVIALVGIMVLWPAEGKCQVVPIIPGGPAGCRNIVIQTPNGPPQFCVVCTFGGNTTINCS